MQTLAGLSEEIRFYKAINFVCSIDLRMVDQSNFMVFLTTRCTYFFGNPSPVKSKSNVKDWLLSKMSNQEMVTLMISLSNIDDERKTKEYERFQTHHPWYALIDCTKSCQIIIWMMVEKSKSYRIQRHGRESHILRQAWSVHEVSSVGCLGMFSTEAVHANQECRSSVGTFSERYSSKSVRYLQ